MQEEWKTVSVNDNYEVSNLGNVRNSKKMKLMTKSTNKGGYQKVGLCKNCRHEWFLVHKLVAIAFIENPDNLPFVDHIDRNALNNKVDNLRWCTRSQNNANRLVFKKASTSRFKGVCLVGHKWQARIQANKEQQVLGYFDTAEEAAEAYNNAALDLHGKFALLNDLTPKPKIQVVVTKKETS